MRDELIRMLTISSVFPYLHRAVRGMGGTEDFGAFSNRHAERAFTEWWEPENVTLNQLYKVCLENALSELQDLTQKM